MANERPPEGEMVGDWMDRELERMRDEVDPAIRARRLIKAATEEAEVRRLGAVDSLSCAIDIVAHLPLSAEGRMEVLELLTPVLVHLQAEV